jgi:F-type H+-transporting ATPase subunit delta
MKHSPKQYARALYEAITVTGANSDAVVASFVRILRRDNALKEVRRIIDAFLIEWNRREDEADVIVTTARGIPGKTQDALTSVLMEATHATRVHVTYNVDPRVLGGANITIGDTLIDGTVRQRLSQLRQGFQN